MTLPGRVHDEVSVPPGVPSVIPSLLERLSTVALRGLAAMYEPRSRSFPHTLRSSAGDLPPVARGMSVRYTAIAALGLSRADRSTCRQVLAGQELAGILPGVLGLALAGRDPGALALAVWAAVEVTSAAGPDGEPVDRERLRRACDRLLGSMSARVLVPAVDHAWTLTALTAVRRSGVMADVDAGEEQVAEATDRAANSLLDAQSDSGLFPHRLPADRLAGLRPHVSSFADQAYAIQALSRYGSDTGSARAVQAAAACAERLAALQGEHGQWWWHYDWRLGSVVERYPVYSVHQYGVAPMALRELRQAGGPDHGLAVAKGLGWLLAPPETTSDLVADELGVVWRKVGRREPGKTVRAVRAATTGASPGPRLPWLDWVFPAGRVDRECRPFELGWLLYAWLAERPLATVEAARPAGALSDQAMS